MVRDLDIDRLYSLPRSDFIAARNALAKRLRAAGDRRTADEVKRLVKPSVAAWAVNQLFHTERETFDRLIAAGAAQRRALSKGTSSRTAGERKRAALNKLLRRAEGLLEEAGSRWTPSLRQRVHRTLESLAAQKPGAGTILGRLTVDLQPTGFDALLGTPVAASPSGRAPRSDPEPMTTKRRSAAASRRREAARARLAALKRDLATARRRQTAAARGLARLERQAADARKRSRAAERRADEARQRATELDLLARQAKSAFDRAARTVARAESKLETETSR